MQESDDENHQQAQEIPSDKDKKLTEKQQAIKQWLQQIPDDPSGLLRAKFRRDHRRYQQERR